MNLEEIKSLIEILEGTDITEIDIEEEGSRLKIKKGFQSFEPAEPGINYVSKEVEQKIEPGDKEETQEQKNENIEEIVAPMVGTFYRAPAPDAEPFIKTGEIIEPGTTLCIIEAMKLMNEIDAEIRGKVVEIFIEDGQPVEYGQPLFAVEKV